MAEIKAIGGQNYCLQFERASSPLEWNKNSQGVDATGEAEIYSKYAIRITVILAALRIYRPYDLIQGGKRDLLNAFINFDNWNTRPSKSSIELATAIQHIKNPV